MKLGNSIITWYHICDSFGFKIESKSGISRYFYISLDNETVSKKLSFCYDKYLGYAKK